MSVICDGLLDYVVEWVIVAGGTVFAKTANTVGCVCCHYEALIFMRIAQVISFHVPVGNVDGYVP